MSEAQTHSTAVVVVCCASAALAMPSQIRFTLSLVSRPARPLWRQAFASHTPPQTFQWLARPQCRITPSCFAASAWPAPPSLPTWTKLLLRLPLPPLIRMTDPLYFLYVATTAFSSQPPTDLRREDSLCSFVLI